MVLFDRDDGPGRCATVVAEVRSTWKSCSQKPFWQKCLKSVGFPTNPQERAGWHFDIFFEKPLGFLCFYVKIVTSTKVLEGFRMARANVHFVSFFARDSWNLICATVVAEVRSTWQSCSQRPFSQKCLKSVGFLTNPQERAGWHFDNFFFWKTIGFLMFLC